MREATQSVCLESKHPHPRSEAVRAGAVLICPVKLPGGGQRTVVIQPTHATTQTSPGGGQTQLVSATGPNGQPVLISRPAGGGDR